MITETLKMSGYKHTINGLNTYQLIVNPNIANASCLIGGTVDLETFYVGIRVWKRSNSGVETELTNGIPEAVVEKSTATEEYKSTTWNCPTIALESTDAIVVRVYLRVTIDGIWEQQLLFEPDFITIQLGVNALNSATWIIYYNLSAVYVGGFWYYNFKWNYDGDTSRIENFQYYSYHTTGSDELPSICFVDAVTAKQSYDGVIIRKGGPCPICRVPVDVTLHFNPTDSYYYFNCPSCNVWVRWCDFFGNIVDLKVVTSQKTTPLDIEEDFPLHTGTF